MNRLFGCAMAVGVLTVGLTVHAQQPEPFMAVGTWKLNVAKSKSTSNQMQSQSRVHTIESRGGGVVVNRIDQVNADGSKQTTYFTSKADGTPYPFIAVRANGQTTVSSIIETRMDSHTLRFTIRDQNGRAGADVTRTVAADGKSYTMSGDQGAMVYERQ